MTPKETGQPRQAQQVIVTSFSIKQARSGNIPYRLEPPPASCPPLCSVTAETEMGSFFHGVWGWQAAETAEGPCSRPLVGHHGSPEPSLGNALSLGLPSAPSVDSLAPWYWPDSHRDLGPAGQKPEALYIEQRESRLRLPGPDLPLKNSLGY